ncbi:hypothetical protein B0H10DRAFT_1964575 [Mycena sp. CBHHK59/15]|nr:hypothetical protein B0H10DRAFT_1964575 [Mycena sp. CBHHK59/15]
MIARPQCYDCKGYETSCQLCLSKRTSEIRFIGLKSGTPLRDSLFVTIFQSSITSYNLVIMENRAQNLVGNDYSRWLMTMDFIPPAWLFAGAASFLQQGRATQSSVAWTNSNGLEMYDSRR